MDSAGVSLEPAIPSAAKDSSGPNASDDPLVAEALAACMGGKAKCDRPRSAALAGRRDVGRGAERPFATRCGGSAGVPIVRCCRCTSQAVADAARLRDTRRMRWKEPEWKRVVVG